MTNKLVKLTRISFNIMVILTLLFFLICIFDNNELIQKFFTIYSISFILFFISVTITTIIRLKSLNKEDFRDRIVGFMKFFIGTLLILSLLSRIFKPDSHDMLKNISISLSTAFGINFFDLLIFKS